MALNQLSFWVDTQTKKHLSDNTSNKIWDVEFHKEASSIMWDRFAVKVRYNGRTYLLEWQYWVDRLRILWDNEFAKRISFIKLNRVSHFQNSSYIPESLSFWKEQKFRKMVEKILDDPAYNPNLQIN